MAPIVGVDNYSFHRLLGQVRAGEDPSSRRSWTWEHTVRTCSELGADVVALETAFMDPGSCEDALTDDTGLASRIQTMISWGHPYGLWFGQSPEAEADAITWLELAARLGHQHMRIVLGHPDLRDDRGSWNQVAACLGVLHRMTQRAGELGVVLAVENHADVRAEQLGWLLSKVDSDALGICLDTANALRVGDDPLEATRSLMPWIVAAHIKDVADDSWHSRSGPRSVPLGTGVLPVAAVVSEVVKCRPQAWLLVEWGHLGPGDLDEVSLVGADIDWLRTHAMS